MMKRLFCTVTMVATMSTTLCGGDVPTVYGGFRGPMRNSVFPDQRLIRTLPAGGPKLLWQYDNLGFGWGSACVTPTTVYFVGAPTAHKTKKEGDPINEGSLFAFGHDGQLKWKKSYGLEIGGRWPGSRTTPTAVGKVILTATGFETLTAFQAETGDVLWKLEPQKVFGSVQQGYHGYTGSPLVMGDRFYMPLCSRADTVPNFFAADLQTGKTIWTSFLPPSPSSNGWSRGDTSPAWVTTPKREMIVCHLWRCIAAVDARDGKPAWQIRTTAGASFTPIYGAPYLLLEEYTGKSSRGMMMMKINDDGTAKELWKKPGLPSFPHGVIADGKLYYFNGGAMACLDAETGQELQAAPASGRPGSVIAADGLIVWQTGVALASGAKKGQVIRITLAKVTAKGFDVIGSFDTSVRCDSDPPWIHPVIAQGRLYIRFHSQVAVYDLKGS